VIPAFAAAVLAVPLLLPAADPLPPTHPPVAAAVHTLSTPVRPSPVPLSWAARWKPYPAWVGTFATCVARHESWSAGLWRAVNHGRGTSASGFAQWENGTWRTNAARVGLRTASRAYLAPPEHQVAVFAFMVLHGGQSAWRGTHCGFGT
jgi:hypothetical protein